MAYTYDVSLSVPPTAEDSGPSMAELSGELNGLLTQLRQISDAMNSAFSTGQVQALTKSTAAAANAQSRLAATTRKAGAAARRSLADFDELNRLQSAAGSSGSSSSSKGKSGKSSGASESAAGDTLLDGWQDFFDKLQKNLAPALALWQTAWQEIRQAAADVWPVIRQAAQDCWDNALSPLLANLRDVFLPGIANSFSEAFAPLVSGVAVTAIQVFGDWFVWLCGLVTDAVNSILLPVLSLILNVWQGLMDGISAAWTAYGQPLMEGVVLAFQNLESWITLLWETTLKPFFQFCIAAVRDLWNQHLQPLWNDLTMLFAEIGLCVLDFWNNVLAPVASWLVSTLGPVFEQVFEFAAGTVIGAVGIIAEWIDVAVNLLRGVVEFLDTTFRGRWDVAWDGISGTVTRVWNGITTSVKGAVNLVIGFVNHMISAIVSGLNVVVRALNGLSFTVPSWVPGIGGSQFGFSLGTLTAPQIPYLAQGAVIPANREFLAVLGDQTHGTNVEAPLATIQQAVAEVMEDMQAGQMAGFETLAELLRQLISAVYGIELTDEQVGRAAQRWQRHQEIMMGGAF